jgi:beta-phosphoglucomutase
MMRAMSRGCVIFDFDGVTVNTECEHLAAYNGAFARHQDIVGGELRIAPEAYFRDYIAYGTYEAFAAMLRDAGRPTDGAVIATLCETKDRLFDRGLAVILEPMLGVERLLSFLEQKHVARAICSGARRAEIERLLVALRLLPHFPVIVAIEDVRRGKPDPEGYNQAFAKLSELVGEELSKAHSLVIEDSAGGCAAGRAAGIPVLGVATTLPLASVSRCADYSVETLDKLSFGDLAGWLGLPT